MKNNELLLAFDFDLELEYLIKKATGIKTGMLQTIEYNPRYIFSPLKESEFKTWYYEKINVLASRDKTKAAVNFVKAYNKYLNHKG